MTVQEQLLTLLSGATAAGTRVYPMTAPDAVVKPYITYQRVSSSPDLVLSGNSGLTNTRMQIDAYARTYAEATSIATQIATLMAAWSVQNVAIVSQDFYDDPVKLFRVSHDYSLWH